MTLNIGVLAIQGDVTENFLSVMASLNELGIDAAVSQVKTAEQISKLDGLIIPGGESTMIGQMSLGCDGIFVGSGIFKAEDAKERARAVVLATTFWEEPDKVKEAQKMIDERQSILGLDVKDLELKMQERGGSA